MYISVSLYNQRKCEKKRESDTEQEARQAGQWVNLDEKYTNVTDLALQLSNRFEPFQNKKLGKQQA